MATRMQQRRGTAAQWTSANPILNAGEMGWESDTNKFKIGDGTNHWADLDYFIDANSTVNPSFGTSIVFEGATADSYETTLQVTDPTADRTITLPDSSGTIALTSDIAELSQDAIDAALTAGTGITKTYNDAANTLTLAVDTTTIQARVADVSDTEIGYLNGVTSAIQTQIDAKAPTNNASFTGTFSAPSGTITSTMIADGTITNDDINASAAIAYSKLNLSGSITSSDITNGTIVNEDINASAAIALSKLATDPLARANHTGTQTASTISDFDTQVRTSKVTDLAAPTSSFSMNSQKITSLATPTSDSDAATKAYVDAATAGLNVHASVQAATTANITLASALENGDTLDGVTLATGNRVLVKNQTDKTENGIYVVKASGAPDRATDYDTAGEVDAGDFIFVEAGTANGKTGYVQTNVITTVGSDNIEFTQFSGAGTYSAGTGLTLTGTTFSANIGTDIQAYNSTLAAVAGGTYTGDDSITTLGTITSGTWNGTTIAVANGGTGITSFGTGIATFLGTPSSANLASAITDETGSGSLVFASSPTLSSPVATTALTLNATAELRLADTDSTHYVGFKAPATVSTNRIWTLPSADGSAGQTLSTNGSGTLSWSTPSTGAAFSELMLIGA